MWALWNVDGLCYSSTRYQPWETPAYGTLAMAQTSTKFQGVLVNGDFFLHRKDWDCWHACDRDGLVDHLAHYAPLIDAVRPGRYWRVDLFEQAWQSAQKWYDDHR